MFNNIIIYILFKEIWYFFNIFFIIPEKYKKKRTNKYEINLDGVYF